MTIEEKKKHIVNYCKGTVRCKDCKIENYCVDSKLLGTTSATDILRWYEIIFGEGAEQQEDHETEEDIASAITNMKWELTQKAFESLDKSKDYSVESEEHRIRMDVVKQSCICLEILSRCEKNGKG